MSEFKTNVTKDAVESIYGNNENKTGYVPKHAFDKNNYLDTSLKHGEKSREIQIRVLTISATDARPFVKIKTHSMKVPKEISQSGFKSYICPNSPEFNENSQGDCPLCKKARYYWNLCELEKPENLAKKKEYYTKLLTDKSHYDGMDTAEAMELYKHYKMKASEPSNSEDFKTYKEKAKKFFSKETYIVRVIQRGKENEGPKFWRFNGRTDAGDPFSQMKSIFEKRAAEAAAAGMPDYNIYDFNNGRDFYLTITPSSSGKGVNITVTDAGIPTPLSNDVATANSWLSDEKVWMDMYSLKSNEYLSIVADDLVPKWDKENGCWVGVEPENVGEDDDVQSEERSEVAKPAPQEEIVEVPHPDIVEESSSVDLPF